MNHQNTIGAKIIKNPNIIYKYKTNIIKKSKIITKSDFIVVIVDKLVI